MTVRDKGYRILVSEASVDPKWDAFLAETHGGHHVQTSIWGRLKATTGWRAVRIVAHQHDRIVAGLQMLVRRIYGAGSVGYVPKGPVLNGVSPHLADLLMTELRRVVRSQRVKCLIMQPPEQAQEAGLSLRQTGFYPLPFEVTPEATVVVNLQPSTDELLAAMHSKTRYNIRLGKRRGIVVREGDRNDIRAFYQMLMSTAKRQGFEEYSEDYIQRMYDEFAAQGWAKLFLVEHQEELVSGLIVIPFGDTVLFKKGAWSGQRGPLCPNEAMHWHAICWAKNAGYRYYDFGGIDRATAEPLCRGVAVSRKQMDQVSRFKIGFGGQVTLMPETLAFPSNALLRWIYQASYRKASQSRILQKMFHKFKFG